MSRGTDQRIELELAVFSLTQPEAAAQVVIQQAAPVPAAPQAFAFAPRAFTAAPPPVQAAPAVVPPMVSQAQPPMEAPAAGRQMTYRPHRRRAAVLAARVKTRTAACIPADTPGPCRSTPQI